MQGKKISNEILLGILAFSPILLIISSAAAGFGLGMIVLLSLAIMALFLYGMRNLIPLSQRLIFVLIVSTIMSLAARMLIEAQFYSLRETVGLFFPLLLINSLVLTLNESVFVYSDLKNVIKQAFYYGVFILVFFSIFGLLRELLSNLVLFSDLHLLMDNSFAGFSFTRLDQGLLIFNSSAGCFFLLAALFAMINLVKQKQ